MKSKEGYKFIQGLIPIRIHLELVEVSRKLEKSNSETLRNTIHAFLKNLKETQAL
ncbi:hypothetical protein KSU1_C0212 [Candidatus Jettenia caeni]|uniref:Ribbon-helix-helix protein CopG domain-containing protein n=1 Tax=Candidatus Jettenia caeni TaxID=247490 RepID=I3IJB3_9BACT|nr:hypothetical protein KSU1_C0212 [Candidatus Jettenia caeni]GIL19714.1 MAG: hypothetical protein BroJett041_08280 [Candidatus Jettenia caeni]GJQ45925.1 MAG: hypothetical protein JETCAE04_16790 [Candidatus Jettenia caeni]